LIGWIAARGEPTMEAEEAGLDDETGCRGIRHPEVEVLATYAEGA
jgi:hypothetical protein